MLTSFRTTRLMDTVPIIGRVIRRNPLDRAGEKAELIALRIRKHHPGHIWSLTDVNATGPQFQQPLKLLRSAESVGPQSTLTTLVTNIGVMSGVGTHQRLQDVGLAMILEAGYESVTVEQIAKAAGVSHMTFFRHFPTKQSLVLQDPFDPAIAAAVAAQPRNLPAITRACRGVREALEAVGLPEEEQVKMRVRIGATTPSLTAGMWANTVATQSAVSDALADGSPPFESQVAAAATIGVLTAAVLAWGTDDSGASLKVNLLEALDILDPSERRSR